MDVPTTQSYMMNIRGGLTALSEAGGDEANALAYLQAVFNNYAFALEQDAGVPPGAFASSGRLMPLPSS